MLILLQLYLANCGDCLPSSLSYLPVIVMSTPT